MTGVDARAFDVKADPTWCMIQLDIWPVPVELRDELLSHLLPHIHTFLAEKNVIEGEQFLMKEPKAGDPGSTLQ